MFFIFGISSTQKQIDFNQNMTCSHCGRYGNLKVIMEYMYFSFFFIPLIKWSKKYYCISSCCQTSYVLNKEIGNRIARGEDITINESDLEVIHKGHICPNCGYKTDEDFQYCPKCAHPL